jgi:putative membrane protein
VFDIVPVLADTNGWGHMGGWGWGAMMFGWVFMAAVIGLIFWAIRSASRPRDAGPRRKGAEEILADRYAHGGIDREEYLQRKADLDDGG